MNPKSLIGPKNLYDIVALQHLVVPLHFNLTSQNNNKLIFTEQLQTPYEVGINEETKVQRGYVTFPRSHSKSGA